MEATKANNGQLTCCVNGVHLHSRYDPQKEAARFVDSLSCDFAPSYVLVVEPALSYCAPYLNQRFPQAILCCIRLSCEFASSDALWQKVFCVANDELLNDSLGEQIFEFMGEEGVCSCAFVSWKPSETAFPKEADFAWRQIRKAVQKGMSVLSTRKYFARRWTKNALRLCLFARKTALVEQGDASVVVCASGPSLKDSIPFLTHFRSRFFLVALSSALSPLLYAGLQPDLCVSSDGGYWAKLHLSCLPENTIPLSLAAEGSCFAHIIEGNTIVPLVYPDGCSKTILREMGVAGLEAARNGTVSGTAAFLALSLTRGDVYFCGLDLARGNGFAHTQPNALETLSSLSDCRLSPTETRIVKASLPLPNHETSPMQIYRSWFSSHPFPARLFRLGTQKPPTLGTIEGISWKDFEERTKDFAQKKMPSFKETHSSFSADKNVRRKQLAAMIERNRANSEWIQDALTLENTLFKRSDSEKRAEIAKKIEEEMDLFCNDVLRALGT